MAKYAYIRVSIKDQNIARQVKAMQELGLTTRQMYVDKQSGKNFDRVAYQRLLKKLKTDDELIIKSIDRLGHHYEEIMEQWRFLTKVKNDYTITSSFDLVTDSREYHWTSL